MLVLREHDRIAGLRFLELSGKPTDEELEVYFDYERTRIANGAQPGVTVLRLTDVWTATQRKSMKDLEDETLGKMKHVPLGVAMVLPNRLARGAITAYYWIMVPPYPVKTVAQATDAYDFAAERLREGGFDVPSQATFAEIAGAPWPARKARPGEGFVPLLEQATGA